MYVEQLNSFNVFVIFPIFTLCSEPFSERRQYCPKGSRGTNKECKELSSDIMNFGGEGIPILYTCDFNARIGNLSDLSLRPRIPIGKTFPDNPNRRNCDNVVNSKKLSNFVKLVILKF